jgi:hypothetical protein
MSQQKVRLAERAIAVINARDIKGYLAYRTENVKLETNGRRRRGVRGIDPEIGCGILH